MNTIQPPANGKRILHVEDDDDIRASVADALEEQGYFVQGAGTSEQGIIRLRTERYDLVLLDIMLDKGTTGKEILDHLLANGFARPPVIVTTAYPPEVLRAEFGGFERVPPVIYKPVRSVDELLRMVAKYVGPRP